MVNSNLGSKASPLLSLEAVTYFFVYDVFFIASKPLLNRMQMNKKVVIVTETQMFFFFEKKALDLKQPNCAY